MSDTVAAMQLAMEVFLSDVNTAMPGVVVSYDAGRNRAVVRPSMAKRLPDGSELAPPVIHEVPVQWPAGGGAVLTFPLKPGDGVLLVFSQRSLENWLSGDEAAPDDPRRFALSDAFAIPGLRSAGVTGDAEAVVLTYASGKVRFEPDGTARFTLPKLIVEGEVEVTGNAKVQGDVTAIQGRVSLGSHSHIGVQPGSGLSGPPQQ